MFLTYGLILACLIFTYTILMTIVNLLWISRKQEIPTPKRWPKLSILIPARNEEATIGKLVQTLGAQDYPHFEIIVLDDQSSDSTLKILKQEKKTNTKLKVLQGKALPKGWVGKPWACHQLQQRAKGDYLLFLDADEWVQPGFLKHIMKHALAKKSDLLTGMPRQVFDNFWTALGLPFLYVASFGFFPFFLIEKPRIKFGFAVGGCLLFSRKSYTRLGGHEGMIGEIVEDVSFGRKTKVMGMNLTFLDLKDWLYIRMYANFAGLWEGFSKNLAPAHGGPWRMAAAAMAWGALWLGPWISLGLVSTTLPWLTVLLSLIGPAIVSWFFRMRLELVVFYPLTVLLWMLMGLNSARQSMSAKGIVWKGRFYPS